MIKKALFFFIIILNFCFVSNHPKGRPTSQFISARGEKTSIPFNIDNGAKIKIHPLGFNESIVFKRLYFQKEGVTDWSLDSISPTLISEDRTLAYKYYSDIPGVVWIEKTLFCDETEVSNLDWIEFVQLSGYSKTHSGANQTMDNINYNLSSQFYYFPVVNISYEDALEYCKWRTELVTEKYNQSKGIEKTSKEYTFFDFRLPSKNEWIKCASFATDTLKYPQVFTTKEITTTINNKDILFLNMLGSKITPKDILDFNKTVKKDMVFNCKRTKNQFLNLETPYYIWDYPSNNFGIFNIIGNVSEMISEKGIAMGGSFRNTFDECKVNSTFKYNESRDCIGFRCVCEIKWPNKK